MKRPLFLIPLVLALSACAIAPRYERPKLAVPASFEEDGAWRLARPGMPDERSPDHSFWWQAYGDATLDDLVQRAMAANQTLKQAEAQLRQSQALAQGAASAYWPTLGVSGQASRQRAAALSGPQLYDTRAGALQASWEPDFWGRVRAGTDAADATARASEADLAAARLSVQAAVVNLFAQLRVDDALIEALHRTVEGYQKSLNIARSQLRAGVATPADVALAESTLATAQAQAVDVELARKQGEHALAVLLGVAPADFHLPGAALALKLPVTPPLLPSQLLERRPDIAGAEARVQAANAQIGVARGAWFPHLVFNASGGGTALGLWTNAPQRVWALGAALTGTLFDGGQRSAQNAQAEAALDQQAASYRQVVLASFQDVEDNLAALRDLAAERVLQEQALAAARESERVLLKQYQAGTATYVAVINAQALSLTAERSLFQLQGRELAASVALTKALGGGYAAAQPISKTN
jgi:NodT family efflux transporter outer membrane factor (OMF) lipoprotein